MHFVTNFVCLNGNDSTYEILCLECDKVTIWQENQTNIIHNTLIITDRLDNYSHIITIIVQAFSINQKSIDQKKYYLFKE